MTEELKTTYRERSRQYRQQLQKVQSAERVNVWLRALTFIAALLLLILYVRTALIPGVVIPLILLFVFVFLVQKSAQLSTRSRHLENLAGVNEDELSGLSGDLSPFKTGEEYQDYHHAYSYDLDLFGEHSIYRMLDRTGTVPGKERLARELLHTETNHETILQRQAAVKELTPALDWRQEFLATARQIRFGKDETNELLTWLKGKDQFASHAGYRILFILVPVVSLLLPVLVLLHLLTPYALLYYLVPLGLVASQAKRILREQNRLGRLVQLFRKYGGLLLLIENKEFTSNCLQDLQADLSRNDQPASLILKKLSGILWGLETRNNLVMAFILNALMLWDIRYMVHLEKWRRIYGDAFLVWLDIIGQIEVLNSLATWAYNRSDLVYPEVEAAGYRVEMFGGGHPLLDPAARVDNDLIFSDKAQIKIITGANMAGKSTLLRTLGVNLVLAMMGAPVCATRFTFTPMPLRTSVRTNDSLGDHESYFYAELVKLGRIMEDLRENGPLFVIVDEMLKGTNSRDKHSGSVGLIHQLIRLGAIGLVATHDIPLGKLSEDYPEHIENHCFEVEITDDQLHFDYLLRAGISQNLNATFLMEHMGIIQKNTFAK